MGEKEPVTQLDQKNQRKVVYDNIVLTEAEAGYWTPSSITHFTLYLCAPAHGLKNFKYAVAFYLVLDTCP